MISIFPYIGIIVLPRFPHPLSQTVTTSTINDLDIGSISNKVTGQRPKFRLIIEVT